MFLEGICVALPGGTEERRKAYLRLSLRARKGRARAQGTMPCSTPLATMRTGVSCISANATETCKKILTG